ncbi:hypothetical protein ACUXQE_001126 [Staphylococcus saprophyticus]
MATLARNNPKLQAKKLRDLNKFVGKTVLYYFIRL